MRGVASLAELETMYDYADVRDMNEALDWHDALQAAAIQKPGG